MFLFAFWSIFSELLPLPTHVWNSPFTHGLLFCLVSFLSFFQTPLSRVLLITTMFTQLLARHNQNLYLLQFPIAWKLPTFRLHSMCCAMSFFPSPLPSSFFLNSFKANHLGKGLPNSFSNDTDKIKPTDWILLCDYMTRAGGHYYTWVSLTADIVITRARNESYDSHFLCGQVAFWLTFTHF